jgi:hypothetical protein
MCAVPWRRFGGFGALICWRVALFERCWDENVSGVALQAD